MPVRDLLSAASTQGAAPADPYFYDVSLLLNGDGTNGAQNNTFLDSSTNNFTITRNGNTTQGSFSPYGTLWSNYFNGTNSELTCTGSALSGQFTMEGWINFSTSSFANATTYFGISSNNGGFLRQETSSTITFLEAGVSIDVTGSFTPVANNWYHLAVTRNASNLMTIWVNGVSSGSATVSKTYTAGTFAIGANHYSGGTTGWFPGYISNVRLVTGSCLYTTTFTPSTTPLTAVSGTQILTCQSNRFIDNSSNSYAITKNGTPQVQRFSPFNPTASYDTATIGGSGYFDGSSNIIAASSTSFTATGNFTAECWFNTSTVTNASQPTLFAIGSDALGLLVTFYSGAFYCYFGAVGGLFTSVTPPLNQWVHFAWARSGSTHTIYINGVSKATSTQSGTITSTGGLSIGKNSASGSSYNYFVGNISDFRYNPTTAVYTSNFTPPTAPLTAISGTQFLLNYVNAGIPDLAMMNDLQTVGTAQVSSTQVKYGTGSLKFNGVGNYLKAPAIPPNSLGSGDFTVEMWVYPTSNAPQYDAVLIARGSSSTTGNYSFALLGSGTLNAPFVSALNGIILQSSVACSLNTWTHVAYTRSGNTWYIFVNGTQRGTTTNSTTFTDNTNDAVFISTAAYDQTADRTYTGYIDDIRITKGLARYTSNFTPPTSALPTY